VSRLIADWRLIIYNFLIVLVSPWILGSKISRYFKKKDPTEIAKGRWTCPVFKGGTTVHEKVPDASVHVVLFGTGWGYVRQIAQLSSALKAARPDITITWAFGNPGAVQGVQDTYPDQRVTFIPFDFAPATMNWLRNVSPDVIVLVEKLWYPNLVACAADCGVKVIVAGGKPRPYESLKNKMWMPVHRWVISRFSRMCLQSDEHIQRIRELLFPSTDVCALGNVKFGLRPKVDPEVEASLRDWLSARGELPLLAAGSTWKGEEELVLQALELVRREVPCTLLIAPRRLNRVDEVREVVEAAGFKVSLRSQPSPNPEVFLLDTLGELATAYQFSQAAYVGGTLERAGHDVVEPLTWGVPVFFGPGGGKIGPGQPESQAAGVGFRVHSSEELAAQWLKVLKSEELQDDLRQRAANLLEEQSRAFDKNVEAIVDVVDQIQSAIL
jgi:3-deoxy-D-manno-octulosonic-acid transferase